MAREVARAPRGGQGRWDLAPHRHKPWLPRRWPASRAVASAAAARREEAWWGPRPCRSAPERAGGRQRAARAGGRWRSAPLLSLHEPSSAEFRGGGGRKAEAARRPVGDAHPPSCRGRGDASPAAGRVPRRFCASGAAPGGGCTSSLVRGRGDASPAARRVPRRFCACCGAASGAGCTSGLAMAAGAGTRALRPSACCGGRCRGVVRASRGEGHVRDGGAHRPGGRPPGRRRRAAGGLAWPGWPGEGRSGAARVHGVPATALAQEHEKSPSPFPSAAGARSRGTPGSLEAPRKARGWGREELFGSLGSQYSNGSEETRK